MSELNFQGSEERTITTQVKFPTYRAPQGRLTHTIPMLLRGTDRDGNVIEGEVLRRMLGLGEFIDGRLNACDETDRNLLRNTPYLVVGDVTVGNPDGSGEVIVKRYQDVMPIVHSITPESELVDWSLPTDTDTYETLKSGDAVVLTPNIASELRNNAYSHADLRKEIYMFLTGSEEKIKDNMALVAEATGREASEVSLDNAMGFYPSSSRGLRPLWVWTVGFNNSYVNSYDVLDSDYARPVGVAPEPLVCTAGAIAQKQDLEGKLVITPGEPFVVGGVTYRQHKGVYMPVLKE